MKDQEERMKSQNGLKLDTDVLEKEQTYKENYINNFIIDQAQLKSSIHISILSSPFSDFVLLFFCPA